MRNVDLQLLKCAKIFQRSGLAQGCHNGEIAVAQTLANTNNFYLARCVPIYLFEGYDGYQNTSPKRTA